MSKAKATKARLQVLRLQSHTTRVTLKNSRLPLLWRQAQAHAHGRRTSRGFKPLSPPRSAEVVALGARP